MRKTTKGFWGFSFLSIIQPSLSSLLFFLMILAVRTSANSSSTKDMIQSNLVFQPPKMDINTSCLTQPIDPSIFTTRNTLADICNVIHPLPTTLPDSSVPMDDLFSLSSPLHPVIHFSRVDTVDCHDTDAWTQERNVHDTKLDAAGASCSSGSYSAAPDDCSPVDVVGNSLTLMESWSWTKEQFPNGARAHIDPTVRFRDCTHLVASGLGVSPVWPNVTTALHEDLSEGRRRVGEILVRCGVINVSRLTPVESTVTGHDLSRASFVCAPVTSSLAIGRPFREKDGPLTTALASWTSEWVHKVVIQPYILGSFHFQYYGESNKAASFVASRIHRVLSKVNNPVQVAIHALWLIGLLAENGAHDNGPFLSVPIFRYLHSNGTIFAEDFMFRTFVTCAMIGDKTVNDATLSTTVWNHLTHTPQAVLNATERYALSCLKWNVVMTSIQWQDTLVYLRACIKMGSVFDPFAYEETSATGIMARYLDELINLSHADKSCTSQQGTPTVEILAAQPIRPSMHWEIPEWCPEDDPVINHKPRMVGIAPGCDQDSNALKVGTTAKDLLDTILGSSNVLDLGCLAQPAGTSFCGPFGAIGARLAHTVKSASTCQSAFRSHGYFTT